MAFALAIGACNGAHAQGAVSGVPNAMQGFSQNRDQPIQIEAASLEMRDKKKEATFSGNVKVVQGDTTMTAKSLVVFYDSGAAGGAPAPANAKGAKTAPMQAASPGPGGSSSIRKLEARGQRRGDAEGAGRDRRQRDLRYPRQSDHHGRRGRSQVVLTQCKNVLRGDRLLVDMTTGVSRVESDSGRVQGLFDQSGQGLRIRCGWRETGHTFADSR